MTGAEAGDQPLFTVVKGQPTDEELAALIVVFSAVRSPGGSEGGGARTSGWSSYWRSVRRPFHPGPDAWRLSGRQR